MICPDCGHKNRDNATFCVICGAQLSHADAFRATPLDEIRPQKKEEDLGSLRDGRYKILKKLGEGGMGRIYLTRDAKMDYLVVIKELLPIFVTQAERDYVEKRFTEEAKILFRLDYRGLPKVIDYFQDKGNMYIVMQYIEGENLAVEVKTRENKRINVEECIRWMSDLLEILKYLHNQNPPIIHRDIKPKNIMLNNRNELFLVDFGLARTIGMHTHTGTSVGTYGYSSPEHYSGKFELSSDLFSIGATFHHLLSADDPQNRDTFDYPRLKKYIPDFPDEFQHIFDKLLDVRKSQRFQRVEFVQEALVAFKKHYEESHQAKPEPEITAPRHEVLPPAPPTAPLQLDIATEIKPHPHAHHMGESHASETELHQESSVPEPRMAIVPEVKSAPPSINTTIPEPAEIKRMSVVGLAPVSAPVSEEIQQTIKQEKPTVVPIEKPDILKYTEGTKPVVPAAEDKTGDTPVAPPKKPAEKPVIPAFGESKTTAINLPPGFTIPEQDRYQEKLTTIQPLPKTEQSKPSYDEDSFVITETKKQEVPPAKSHIEDKSAGLTKLELLPRQEEKIVTQPVITAIQPKPEAKMPEPPKVEIPKQEIPKAEPQKIEIPKAEPPGQAPSGVEVPPVKPAEKKPEPVPEPPKVEIPQPKPEAKKPEPPKVEIPKHEIPKAEPQKIEIPKAEPPGQAPSGVEVPPVKPAEKKPEPVPEPPKVEIPQPKPEVKKPEPPKVEIPKQEIPKAELPKVEPPKPEPKQEPVKAGIPVAVPPKVEQPKPEPPRVEIKTIKPEFRKPEPPRSQIGPVKIEQKKPNVVKNAANLQFKPPEKKAEQPKPALIKQGIDGREKTTEKTPDKTQEKPAVIAAEKTQQAVAVKVEQPVAVPEIKEENKVKQEPVKPEPVKPVSVSIPEKAEPAEKKPEEKKQGAVSAVIPAAGKKEEKPTQEKPAELEKVQQRATEEKKAETPQIEKSGKKDKVLTKAEKKAAAREEKTLPVKEEKIPEKQPEKKIKIQQPVREQEFDEFSQDLPKPKSKIMIVIPAIIIFVLLAFGVFYKISSDSKHNKPENTPAPIPSKTNIVAVPNKPVESAVPSPAKTDVAVAPSPVTPPVQEKTAFKVESGIDADKIIFFDKSKKRTPVTVSIKDLKKNDPNAEFFEQSFEPGSYTVKFIRENYVDIKRDLELKSGNEISISKEHISWIKKPSLLVKTNLEANISVYCKTDGRNTGKGKTTKGKDGKFSLTIDNLDENKYKVVATRSGYYEETKDNVSLTNGKTGEVSISLREIPPQPKEPAYKPPVYEPKYEPPPAYKPPVRPVDPITGH
ncbi:MAG: protein kinase [Firmicutes bacterium]|nr:protein kinase [Bacillota bacterium]